MAMIGFLTGLILIFVLFIFLQHYLCDASNPCAAEQSCGKCLQADPRCAWCAADLQMYNASLRCNLLENMETSGCPPGHVVFPLNDLTVTQDEELTKRVQLGPQKVQTHLRVGSSSVISVKFRQAKDYPIDIYFLTDASNTMAGYKTHLSDIASTIADSLLDVTDDFRLGFGTFVDKPTLPFIHTVRSDPSPACAGCDFAYSFRHRMNLTSETGQFQELMRKTRTAGNFDHPEGGFDGLMQAIACTELIGWRNHSRRIIVFATDAAFHYAGDGKLAGIVVPNDGKCHMAYNEREKVWDYTEDLKQDYPSVQEINRAVKRKNIHVIFAVPDTVQDLYKQLSGAVSGSVVGQLSSQSDNIVEVVKNQYNKIRSAVTLTHDAPDFFKVSFQSQCLQAEVSNTSSCEGLKTGSEVAWNVTIELLRCPVDGPVKGQFRIWARGLSDEVVVQYSALCQCDCALPENQAPSSAVCSGHGDLGCGVCQCHEGYDGQRCQCRLSDKYTFDDKFKGCVVPNATVRSICSGRGQCVCGQCQCDIRENPEEKVYGEFCQHDNFNCEKVNGQLCSGHGSCDKGVCSCAPGWTGPSCACTTSLEPCKTKSGKVCNGHGVCKCGKCHCNQEGEHRYGGPKCQECPSCPTTCQRLERCVACWDFQAEQPLVNGSTAFKANVNHSESGCPAECLEHRATFAEVLVVDMPGERACSYRDTSQGFCTVHYTHYESDATGELIVEVLKQRECPVGVNPYLIVGSLVAGILFMGIMLLCAWKVVLVVYDRQQVAKFEKETAEACFEDVSTIHQSATVTYRNPAYRRSLAARQSRISKL
ncbi:integrin beta pat-3-like [Paramacrobiotus metropolitanus]|uniref:integrin beta pat-3-like n=1 Tax=Paramacrobiotus metropolitanus TaxID=2943436 RepID=UPI002445641B|nr:integrin beta pat-3-like [Paramacrobiotus metropolitanus]